MSNLNDLIPIPSKDVMNRGLSAAKESTMLRILGKPGVLSKDCSNPGRTYAKLVKYGVDVGPFKVSGHSYAVESLLLIFQQVKQEQPDVFSTVKTGGVLCVRSRRSNPSRFSNHSWGTAIDLYFGGGVVRQGLNQTQRGVYQLFPYFNNHGWYWGAEFSGDSVDSMHFELAEETILKLGQ
ncbi:MAG TPA: M15 family metallopeptidase [Chitinophaga sp.]|uniref:M15 family metallopeptidase n=1 Tax=Chitinophaga sp. TaxID=1869181 RepID=UPI002C3993CD|nr:M15 family metallopeptidase [Chitinophaga sp.]HVI47817.1 M15 family metallopeptidase [Chitinophaga sp.]